MAKDPKLERVYVAKLGEDALQLDPNIFWITEPVAALADSDRTNLSGPGVDVLEQMLVKVEIVPNIQVSGRKGLVGTGQKQRQFRLFQQSSVLDVEKVPEDRRGWIAKGIGFGSIVQRLLSANRFLDQGATLLAA